MTTIKIRQDNDAESPRDWDNMGTMIAFHGRYNLGDKGHSFRSEDFNGWDEMKAAILKAFPGGEILPLYLYDHSGITIKTTPFDCRWDSGQVGFIVANKVQIRNAMGVVHVTDKVRERARDLLRSEVEVYDQYLRGDVYYFSIVDDDGEVIDSCGGFFGDDPFKNGMAEHIPTELLPLLKETSVSY